jgi:hypothetical protein
LAKIPGKLEMLVSGVGLVPSRLRLHLHRSPQ